MRSKSGKIRKPVRVRRRKLLEKDLDEAWDVAHTASFENYYLKKKLDKDAKEEEETKVSAKNARLEACKQTEDVYNIHVIMILNPKTKN